jgi:flagellar hook-basal body complex protein FliE
LGLDDEDDALTSEQEEIERTRREQRFLPRRDAHQLRNKFMDTYSRDEHLPKVMKRPKSLIREPLSLLSSETETVYSSEQRNIQHQPQKQQQPDIRMQGHPAAANVLPGMPDYEDLTEAAHQQMEQEALMLQSMVHSDLDSVQKMEQQMVSITTLLTQFSELVSEQSEEVWQIHDTAKETNENMKKGQETLVDAAEKTHQSRHYMAKGIFAMGCLLLLFHWLRQ